MPIVRTIRTRPHGKPDHIVVHDAAGEVAAIVEIFRNNSMTKAKLHNVKGRAIHVSGAVAGNRRPPASA